MSSFSPCGMMSCQAGNPQQRVLDKQTLWGGGGGGGGVVKLANSKQAWQEM